MIEEIYNENPNEGEGEKKSESVSSFIKQLYPTKNVDDILIDTREFDLPKKTKPEVTSRRERRLLERKQKKADKSIINNKVRKIENEKDRRALEKIKDETREEIGKRLAPILFGIK